MPPNCSIAKEGCRESDKVDKYCARDLVFCSLFGSFGCARWYVNVADWQTDFNGILGL